SAGGHLALLLGLDPQTTPNPIKAICALYPPTDLIAIVPPEKQNRSDNLVAQLLGGPVSDRLALAREASPVTYVSKHAPPVLLIHGDRDNLVPLDQSLLLIRRCGAREPARA
ncbi:MAG: prolyl oligopeptidase family serine peptidase, partial [Chthoniobacterales bacterium]